MNILLTSGRTPAPLELARHLKALGNKVFLIESSRIHLCTLSRVFTKKIRVPAPAECPQKYIAAVKKIISENNIELVIPMYEEILYLAQFKSEFEADCFRLIPDLEVLERFHNKFTFIEMLKELNVKCPETVQVSNAQDAADAVEQMGKSIIKPVYSRFGTFVKYNPNKAVLNKLDITEKNPWVVQEQISGRQFGTYILALNGDVLAMSLYAQEVTYNNVSINLSHSENPEILDWIRTLIKKSAFTGQMSFDLIVNDQGIFPIEANPRVTSGIHLLVQDPNFIQQLTAPVKREILPSGKNSCAAKQLLLPTTLAFWNKGLFKWKCLLKDRDIIFQKNDPLPFLFGFYLYLLYLIFLCLIKMKNSQIVSSMDIDWDGGKK